MKSDNIKQLFVQAEEDLEKSRMELYKPAEDVVRYSVCIFARRALYRYINCLYLFYKDENGEPAGESQSLEELFAYCSKYDERIKAMDLESIYCKGKGMISDDEPEVFFCNDVFKLKYCSDLAENVRELVIERTGKDTFNTIG